MARLRRSSMISVLASGLLALTGAAACDRGGGTAAASEGPHAPAGEVWLSSQQVSEGQIKTGTVGEQSIDDVIVSSGRVTFDDQRVAHVYSPVTGRVIRVDGNLGQRVKKGQSLAVLQSPDIGQVSSDLGKADADLVAAKHDVERKKSLYEAHAASAADYEIAEDNFRKASAEHDRAVQRSALLRAGGVDSVTQAYSLLAPIDGEIIARSVSPGIEIAGQYGNGQAATELFTVGELDQVWIMADVFEQDLARVHVGADVSVRAIAYAGKEFKGRVDWIAGALDPETRTARVRCTFANPEKLLKPEMYTTVRIAVDGRKAIAVPKDAVLRLGEQTVAFVQRGKTPEGRIRFERVPVTVDDALDGAWLPVTHGLEMGDVIVTSGLVTVSNAL